MPRNTKAKKLPKILNWKATKVLPTRFKASTRQKPHQVILRSPLLRIHYYQNKRLQVKES